MQGGKKNMFREMRKKDRELAVEEALQILKAQTYGILSTMGEDGYPYGVPVNYVVDKDKIYFHCAKDAGHKVENIRYCPRVCFTVVGDSEVLPSKFSTRYESAVVYGECREADHKQKALEKLIEKYSPDYRECGLKYIKEAMDITGVYEITIEQVTGKACR